MMSLNTFKKELDKLYVKGFYKLHWNPVESRYEIHKKEQSGCIDYTSKILTIQDEQGRYMNPDMRTIHYLRSINLDLLYGKRTMQDNIRYYLDDLHYRNRDRFHNLQKKKQDDREDMIRDGYRYIKGDLVGESPTMYHHKWMAKKV